MTAVTIPLSEASMQKLQQVAKAAQSTPEDLVKACVEEWLKRAAPDFAAAAEYVLHKNTELYRRLA